MGNFKTLTVISENSGETLEVFINKDNELVLDFKDSGGENFVFAFYDPADVEEFIRELKKLKKELE